MTNTSDSLTVLTNREHLKCLKRAFMGFHWNKRHNFAFCYRRKIRLLNLRWLQYQKVLYNGEGKWKTNDGINVHYKRIEKDAVVEYERKSKCTNACPGYQTIYFLFTSWDPKTVHEKTLVNRATNTGQVQRHSRK